MIQDGSVYLIWHKGWEEAMIRQVFRLKNGRVRLMTLNPTGKPLVVKSTDIEYRGKVLCRLRTYPSWML